MKKSLVITFGFIILILLSQVIYSSEFVITRLTDYEFDENVDISGDTIVWQRSYTGRYDIFMYDGETITNLTDNEYRNNHPQIDGNNIAWVGGNAYGGKDVFLYDGNIITNITNNLYGVGESCWMKGNNIVWRYALYDGSNIYSISEEEYYEYTPQREGDKIVWAEYDGHDREIFLFDGSTYFQITDNDHNEGAPRISGDNIVWSGYNGSDSEIFFYNGSIMFTVTDNDYDDRNPEIDGNKFAWSTWGNTRGIFFTTYDQNAYNIVSETYEDYQIGDDPNIVSNWKVYGLEVISKSIQEDFGNKFLEITFDSPAGNIPPVWAPIVIAQDVAWSPSEDLTDGIIVLDIRTDLANVIENVLGFEILAVCNETGVVESFRIPDSDLLSLPCSTHVWLKKQIPISKLTYNEASWKTPDLTQVEKVQILVFQTVTDIVANGSIEIDNFKVVGFDNSQTITLIEENYNSYSIGSDPNLSSDWFAFGLERLSQVVQGANGDNWIDIAFSSPSGIAPAWCSFGLAQLEAWTTVKDFTDATIKLDIKTDLSQSISNVMALEVFAVCNETGLVESFRIPDANLIALPSSSEGWVNVEIDISELTHNESAWKTPDYSQIEKVQVLFLQTATDIVDTGTVSIDNFKVEKAAQ